MTEPRVSFSPKLGPVPVIARDRPAQDAAQPPRKVVWLRILGVALIVFGIGTGLHLGTSEHRDAKRRAQIQEAITTSGVESPSAPEPRDTGSTAP